MVKQVRALARGLDLLEILNAHDGADISTLTTRAALPRGTTYRMMETLIAQGFVTKGADGANYWLTKKVRVLSGGYQEDSLLVQSAKPLLDTLCIQTEWPVSLTLPLGIKMVVRAHTDILTPLVLVKIPIGHAVSMINSAAGLAYLSHCTVNQRDILLDAILKAPAEDVFEERMRDRTALKTVFKEIRARGYSYRATDDTHAALGVPILLDETVVAALSVRYFTSATSRSEAAAKHFAATRDTSVRIAEVWASLRAN